MVHSETAITLIILSTPFPHPFFGFLSSGLACQMDSIKNHRFFFLSKSSLFPARTSQPQALSSQPQALSSQSQALSSQSQALSSDLLAANGKNRFVSTHSIASFFSLVGKTSIVSGRDNSALQCHTTTRFVVKRIVFKPNTIISENENKIHELF